MSSLRSSELCDRSLSVLVELALRPLTIGVIYEHAAPCWASEFLLILRNEFFPLTPELDIGSIIGSPFWGMSCQRRTAVSGLMMTSGRFCILETALLMSWTVSPLGGFLRILLDLQVHSGHHCKGRASITPPHDRGLPMSMPLPSERLSVFSFWGMSSPLSRARYR